MKQELKEKISQATSYASLVIISIGCLYEAYDEKKSPATKALAWAFVIGVILFGVFWLNNEKKEKRKKIREINRALEEFPEGCAMICKKNKSIYLAYKVDFTSSPAPTWHLARLSGKEGKLEKKTVPFSNIKSYRIVDSNSKEVEEQVSNIRLALYEENK